ncbi:hypothetical protein SAY87_014298 [Trapa incisa]|uniref:Uncharacterized protein n=1 Tax=Trapa incisa TaxID=236973 RepID=A0AAN7JKE4_9MYRT|nr:hypothetical protein SAY87_014298 [Trapa incisa]
MALASASATASSTSIVSSPSPTSNSRPFGALFCPKPRKIRSYHVSSQFSFNCIVPPLARTHLPTLRFSSIADSPVTEAEIPGSSIDSWKKFAENVSGEWDGFGADFTCEGKPVELPESVVPEAYREWEVKVFDWQTQCPTLANPKEQVLQYRTIKLLPTVGCEADAATRHSIDERSFGDMSSKAEALAYESSGCYIAVWSLQDKEVEKLIELEYCLINPQDRESRVRISQVISIKKKDAEMSLKSIKVFCEQWYGPFRNGDQLGGCVIRDSAFASTPSMNTAEVIGTWEGLISVATFHRSQNSSLQSLEEAGTRRSKREESMSPVLLPKQLWCSMQDRENAETISQIGWVFSHGQCISASCIFSSDGELKEVAISRETLQGDKA